jgi:uncharacterized membrane protein
LILGEMTFYFTYTHKGLFFVSFNFQTGKVHMTTLMIISSIAGGLVALLGFFSSGTDIQLTIGFVGSAWCLTSAGIAAVLERLSHLLKHIDESTTKARE